MQLPILPLCIFDDLGPVLAGPAVTARFGATGAPTMTCPRARLQRDVAAGAPGGRALWSVCHPGPEFSVTLPFSRECSNA